MTRTRSTTTKTQKITRTGKSIHAGKGSLKKKVGTSKIRKIISKRDSGYSKTMEATPGNSQKSVGKHLQIGKEDWIGLCRKCHIAFDKDKNKRVIWIKRRPFFISQ